MANQAHTLIIGAK